MIHHQHFFLIAILVSLATAAPLASNSSGFSQEQNGLDAQKLNAQFATLSANDSCTSGDQACVAGAFAQCVENSWQLTPCSSDLSCFALPLVAKAGTSLACDTQADAEARFAAAGVQGGITGNGTTASNMTTGGDDDCAGTTSAPLSSATSTPSAGTLISLTAASPSPIASQTFSMKKRQFGSSYVPTFGFGSPTTTGTPTIASNTLTSSIASTPAIVPLSNVTTSGLASSSVAPAIVTSATVSGMASVASSSLSPSIVSYGTANGLTSSTPLVTPAPTTITGADNVTTVVVVTTVIVTVTADTAAGSPASSSFSSSLVTTTNLNSPAVTGVVSGSPTSSPLSYAPVTTINLNSPAITPTSASTSFSTSSNPSNDNANAVPSASVTSTGSSPFNFVSASPTASPY